MQFVGHGPPSMGSNKRIQQAVIEQTWRINTHPGSWEGNYAEEPGCGTVAIPIPKQPDIYVAPRTYDDDPPQLLRG